MKRTLKPLVWSIDIFVQGVVTGNATVSMSLSNWSGFLQSPGLREPPVWIQDSPSDIHCIQWSNHFIYWSLQACSKSSMITFDIWFQNIFRLIGPSLVTSPASRWWAKLTLILLASTGLSSRRCWPETASRRSSGFWYRNFFAEGY